MVPSGDVDIQHIRHQLELNDLTKNQILDLFDALEQIQITKACLAETKIANTISKYKKNSDTEIVQRCKSLLRQWRETLTQTLKTPTSSTPNDTQKDATKDEKPNNASPSFHPQQETTKDTLKLPSKSYTYSGPYSCDIKRDKAREILFNAFIEGYPPEQTQNLYVTEACQVLASIEEALWEYHSVKQGNFKNYQSQLRSIKCNLADKKNPEFNLRIYLGVITPEQLTTLSSTEMASDAKKRERTKTKRDALEACQSDWDVRNIKRTEGQFPCGKCHSSNTTYFQLQTRSSDEPMTTFVSCLNCGNRWKF